MPRAEQVVDLGADRRGDDERGLLGFERSAHGLGHAIGAVGERDERRRVEDQGLLAEAAHQLIHVELAKRLVRLSRAGDAKL